MQYLPPGENASDDAVMDVPGIDGRDHSAANHNRTDHLRVMIVTPTLETGASDRAAIDLVRILADQGHHALVVSRGGKRAGEIGEAGGHFVAYDVAGQNPFALAPRAFTLARLAKLHGIQVIHALGRAPAWPALIAARMRGTPLVTSWYKGFRDQNLIKRAYNSVMVRGARITATSDELAELICARHGTPLSRIDVMPVTIDTAWFDAAQIAAEQAAQLRHQWGIPNGHRVVLAPGRMIRRKGHHVLIEAAQILKRDNAPPFVVVFTGEDQGHTRYTGDLWDLIARTGTNDVVRMAGHAHDVRTAYAAADMVVSASIQAEGVQRCLLEAQAMARPVIASDLSAGPDVVLAPPAIGEDRMTGLRVPAGQSAALAQAIRKLLVLPGQELAMIGARGRDWMRGHYDEAGQSGRWLALYDQVVALKHRSR